MTDSSAVAALKKRRRRSGAAAVKPTPEELAAERPPGAPPMRRRQPFLFDPAEMAVVVEIGGVVPPADFAAYYVVAEHDASESIVPDGCKTPVSRTLWRAGQHVRKDVYYGWLRDHGLPCGEQTEEQAGENAGETTDGEGVTT
jgi:hypothetical protein